VSQDKLHIYLGSGQVRNIDLSIDVDRPSLFGNDDFGDYFDILEMAEQFVGVVFDSERNSLKESVGNAIVIQDLSPAQEEGVNNEFLVSALSETESILKVVPYDNLGKPDFSYVSKGIDQVSVLSLETSDQDGDGMSGNYEAIHGLDDSYPDDRFLDLDNDGLSNYEEYTYATDPTKADTDGDGWNDAYEVLNQTDPLDRTEF